MSNKLKIFFGVLGLGLIIASVAFVFSLHDLKTKSDSHKLTSKVQVSPTPLPTPTPKPVTMIFGGDMMFDRHIRQKAEVAGGYDFILAPLENVLTSVDLVVANLEGPITNNQSISVNSIVGGPRNYTFTFDPAVVKTLARFNLKLVNLGNNHILNFGQDGLVQTLNYLDKGGIDWFGYTGGKLKTQNLEFKTQNYVEQVGWVDQRTIRGQKFLFVNFNQFINQELEPLTEFIRQKRNQVDWIIVMPHWDNEYQTTPAPITRQKAHRLVEAGADLIVGAHPHVVAETERYQGKRIYYSLGNFVFDQYFEPAVRKGLLVKVEFSSNRIVEYNEIYTWLNTNGQTELFKK